DVCSSDLAAVQERRHATSSPALRSAYSASSASSWESSTSSTRQGAACGPGANPVTASALLRRFVEHCPEPAERAHRVEELVHVHRLDHVGVHAQVPAAGQVAF